MEHDLCAGASRAHEKNFKLDWKKERGKTRLARNEIDLQHDDILGTV